MNLKRKVSYLLCALLPVLSAVLPCSVRAAKEKNDTYIFSEIDHLQGLSHSSVICIFKDDSELMWFGTYDGVSCFDGAEMEIFRADFSKSRTLDNNVIYGIGQADGNNLWISTQLSVNRFSRDDRQVVANYAIPPGAQLCSNSHGDTWLVGLDSVAYYNTLLGRFVGIADLNISVREPKERSFVTGGGELWIFPDSGHPGDLCKITLNGFGLEESAVRPNVVSSVRFHHKAIESIFYQDDVSFCFVDSDKDLYIYDIWRQAKVYIRNIESLLCKYGPIAGVVPFYDDFMIAFRTNGLVRLKAIESYREEIIDRNLRIFSLFRDSEQGILWIGVDGKGAMMYTKKHSIATNLMTQDLSPNFTRQVRSMMTDPYGGLWFGTKGDGLIHIERYDEGCSPDKATVYTRTKRQTAQAYVREDTEFPVFSLKPSEHMNGFWIGSGSEGLFYHLFGDTRIRSVDTPPDKPIEEVHGIYEANDSVLYVATARSGFCRLTLDRSKGGIAVKSQKYYRFFHEQQEIGTFFSLLPEGDSILWLGSRERGLIRFDLATENYWVYSLREMLDRSVDDVLCIGRARNGDLLVGTTSGLVRLSFEGKRAKARYTGREQGLLNDMIHGILEDSSGFLWLSTNKGLIKYNPSNGSSHAYYYSGGVRIGEFSDDAYYKCPYSGRLFFGGGDGLLYVDRTSSDDREYYPEILLRRLLFGRRVANLADHYGADRRSLQFRYADEGFTLVFAAPDFIFGSDIEYAWMLEGYDKEWTPFGMSHQASYTGGPVGSYVFRIRYRKDIFDTDFKTISIPIRIRPLWYQTLAARLSFLLLVVAAVLYLSFLLRRSIRHKRILSELLKREDGNTPEVGVAYRNHAIVGALTSVYRECDALRGESVASRQRHESVDRIREAVLSLLLPSDLFREPEGENPPPSNIRFSLAGPMFLKEISDEVLFLLIRRGVDVSNIDVDIPESFSFPVFKNAFRVFFNYVYLFVAGGQRRFSVGVEASEQRLTLTLRSSRGVLKRLYESFTTAEFEPTVMPREHDAVFGICLLHRFVRNILEQLGPEIVYSDSEPELKLHFPPAEAAEAGSDKKIVLLLEDRDEMCWFVNGMLSAEYAVHQVRSVQQAVEFMESSHPAVFLVDMMMYADAENTFMEFIDRSGALLAKTAFVPMLTWKASSPIQRSLIMRADSFVVLPYDIVLLREIVHKAIYGRMGAKQIRIEGLTENIANMFTCTTGEQVAFIRRIVAIIEDNIDRENLGSSFIAEQLAMSQRQFYRKFKEISEHSPTDLIKNYRLEKAALLLLDGKMAIKDVMAEIGITSRSYLYREFSAKFGMTPSDYRNIHGGE